MQFLSRKGLLRGAQAVQMQRQRCTIYTTARSTLSILSHWSQIRVNLQKIGFGDIIEAIPTIFIDGGFNQTVGSGSTPQQTEDLYRPIIEQAGTRTVHPLELTTNVTGHGNAKLDITVTVKNTDTKLYIGIVRSYVTEIISRWIAQNGHPYHFGFLDYAIKKVVILSPQKSQTFTVTWDGAAKHGNLTFPDIVDNNIMVISTVSHWLPHLVAKEQQYIGTHFAFYIDQTTGAMVQ
jgi:hypothetical protein